MRRSIDPPIALVKWYHVTKWILEQVDNFPKNQRFIFGQIRSGDNHPPGTAVLRDYPVVRRSRL